MTPEQELGRAQDDMRDLIVRHWDAIQPRTIDDLPDDAIDYAASRIAELLVGSGAVVRAADALRGSRLEEGPLVVTQTRTVDPRGAGRAYGAVAGALHRAYLDAATDVTAACISLNRERGVGFGRTEVQVRVRRFQEDDVAEDSE